MNKVVKFGLKNMIEIHFDGNRVAMYSYDTPVVFFDGKDYWACADKISKTTSKHINGYLRTKGAHDIKRVPKEEILIQMKKI